MSRRWISDREYVVEDDGPSLIDLLTALADDWDAKGRDWHWNSASRNVWLTAAHDLRALIAASSSPASSGTSAEGAK